MRAEGCVQWYPRHHSPEWLRHLRPGTLSTSYPLSAHAACVEPYLADDGSAAPWPPGLR